jgi:hypothetical protein
MKLKHSAEHIETCFHGRPMEGECSECAENRRNNAIRARQRAAAAAMRSQCDAGASGEGVKNG